jgi:hypothetical protein
MQQVERNLRRAAPTGTGSAGGVAALSIERILKIGRVSLCNRISDKPFHIHHNVLPTMLLQVRGHPVRVGLHLRFAHRGSIRVPTVPSHRRRCRQGWSAGWAMKRRLPVQDRPGAQQKRTQQSDMAAGHAHVYLHISYGTNELGIAYSRASGEVAQWSE